MSFFNPATEAAPTTPPTTLNPTIPDLTTDKSPPDAPKSNGALMLPLAPIWHVQGEYTNLSPRELNRMVNSCYLQAKDEVLFGGRPIWRRLLNVPRWFLMIGMVASRGCGSRNTEDWREPLEAWEKLLELEMDQELERWREERKEREEREEQEQRGRSKYRCKEGKDEEGMERVESVASDRGHETRSQFDNEDEDYVTSSSSSDWEAENSDENYEDSKGKPEKRFLYYLDYLEPSEDSK